MVTKSLLTLIRYQNSSGFAINNQEYLKLEIQVANPNKVTTGGISVQLISNLAKYIYEVGAVFPLFETKLLALTTGTTTYFWGLPAAV